MVKYFTKEVENSLNKLGQDKSYETLNEFINTIDSANFYKSFADTYVDAVCPRSGVLSLMTDEKNLDIFSDICKKDKQDIENNFTLDDLVCDKSNGFIGMKFNKNDYAIIQLPDSEKEYSINNKTSILFLNKDNNEYTGLNYIGKGISSLANIVPGPKTKEFADKLKYEFEISKNDYLGNRLAFELFTRLVPDFNEKYKDDDFLYISTKESDELHKLIKNPDSFYNVEIRYGDDTELFTSEEDVKLSNKDSFLKLDLNNKRVCEFYKKPSNHRNLLREI